MASNLHIDERLLEQAVKAGGRKSEAVNSALEEYVRHRERQKITELFGIIEYEPGHDPKNGRRKR
jgi:hypothetical protein